LPAERALSIILPPLQVLSMAAVTQWDQTRESFSWQFFALVLSTSAAGLATAVGISRFRSK
jgi:hypothetical protein